LSLAFDLPHEREAHRPPELRGLSRDGVGMLVSTLCSGTHQLTKFLDLPKYLRAGDLVVVNDSATIPAALTAQRANGSSIALHLSTRISDTLWIVEPRRTLVQVGERFTLPGGGIVELFSPLARPQSRLWYARLTVPGDITAYLNTHARPISYGYLDEPVPVDYYQTIFAREPGSVEMPSAGRPFTLRVVDALYRKGVNITPVTLHCGVASPESHEPPVDERFSVPAWTAAAVNRTRESGGRIIAIGTTVVRALEGAASEKGIVRAMSGWTSRIVDPQHPPRVVGGLLTGFHEPRASHLNMLEAFAPARYLRDAYETALTAGLLWHEFGDVHLIIR
jgi:S-adenosylmethionine:tRNA ribosyltransferase-isomerase